MVSPAHAMARSDLSGTGPGVSSPQMSKQRRAPAPSLSPQHLALARSLPHSNASTPTPSLLTPPVSGTPAMSPPPRHEADDYMNVQVHEHDHHKRKHPRNKSRKRYNTKGSEESRSLQRPLRSGPVTAASNGSDCELCAAGISEGDEDGDCNAPPIKILGRLYLPQHLHGTQNRTEVDGVHVQTLQIQSSPLVAVDDPDSPAVNALQSLSLQIPIRSNSQGLRRVSTALTNTFNLFRPNPSVSFAATPSHNASKKAEESLRRSSAYSKSLAYMDTNRGHPKFQEGKDASRTLGTPATITLRKASNVYVTSPITTSMSASLTCQEEHERPADAPASELLAFYSSPTLEKRPMLTNLPSSESAEAPRSLKEQPTFNFDFESQSFRRGSKSVAQFSDIPNARRCSMPAEAALAFADVHVAPGSFAVGPSSRKQSFEPTEFSRRISTVQFWSRNSVHEIIWREDDKTSDSSLTASSRASQHVGHSLRSTPSPESESSPTKEAAIESKEKLAALRVVPDTLSMFTRMPDNLFRWSWGAPSASADVTPRAVNPESDPLDQVAKATARAVDTRGEPLGQVPIPRNLIV